MRSRFFRTEGFRLTAIYATIFSVSMLALGISALTITEAALRDQIVQYSQATIAAMREGYKKEGAAEAQEVALQLLAEAGAADFLLLQQDGRKIAGNMPATAQREGLQEIPNPRTAGNHILGVGTLVAPGLYAFSGRDLSFVQAVRTRILNIFLWLFAGTIILAVLGGLLVSRSFLARTDAIARTCRAIMRGDMKQRIPVRGSKDVLDDLALTINEMLGRIVTLMDNLRQVSSDIAHDLRTPLTHLQHRLERARTEARTPEEIAAALDGATAAANDLLALFAAILRIAQVEGGARRAGFCMTDLSAVLRKLHEVYGAVSEDAGHILELEATPPFLIQGDPELLFQLFANLVENAIMHTPSGTKIRIDLQVGPKHAVVRVIDNGPGVPTAERPKLFLRFYRLEASRSKPGHGLGLALVAAIADLHGGNVVVEDMGEMRGMCVRVSLPASS